MIKSVAIWLKLMGLMAILTLTMRPALADQLAGSQWGIGQNQNVFVQFQPVGKLIGNGGCNRFFGTYAVKSETIQIGPLGSTRKLCSSETMTVEQRFLADLQASRSFRFTHFKLVLFDGDGSEIAVLLRQDWD